MMPHVPRTRVNLFKWPFIDEVFKRRTLAVYGAILKRIKRHITYLVIKVYFFRDIVKNESADSAI